MATIQTSRITEDVRFRMPVHKKEVVLPFLKWAGGKRWLTAAYPEILQASYDRYIEPFLGSGAMFFFLAPAKAILSDKNEDLIVTYQAIKDDWRSVKSKLATHHRRHSEKYYYMVRAMQPRSAQAKAARFIYLNRTCWNGLYRVNRKGQFNVPVGTKSNAVLATDDFESVSSALMHAQLRTGDFEESINLAGAHDLVFVDPPYTVKHNLNGFVKYNEKLFSWADQERLRDSVVRAVARGATVVISNANHISVLELYAGIGEQKVLTRSSLLAADVEYRGRCQELIIWC